MNHKHRSRDHDRQWYQQQRGQSHDKGRQYHRRQLSSCRHPLDRWIDEHHQTWQTSHRLPDGYEHSQGSIQREAKWHQRHHQTRGYHRTISSNHRSSWNRTGTWSSPLRSRVSNNHSCFKKILYILKAKFRACVGKYRITLAVFPLQREIRPSSRYVRAKASPIPL